MPQQCYITIEGAIQGKITKDAFTNDSVGNIFVQDHEDEMPVQAIEHNVVVPKDVQSNQPTSRPIHGPLCVTTVLNKAIPLCYNAMQKGEELQVILTWYRLCTAGTQEAFFTTKLTDAKIVEIDCKMPHCQDPSSTIYTQLIQISLSYRAIAWDHLISTTSGSADWRNPDK